MEYMDPSVIMNLVSSTLLSFFRRRHQRICSVPCGDFYAE